MVTLTVSPFMPGIYFVLSSYKNYPSHVFSSFQKPLRKKTKSVMID